MFINLCKYFTKIVAITNTCLFRLIGDDHSRTFHVCKMLQREDVEHDKFE